MNSNDNINNLSVTYQSLYFDWNSSEFPVTHYTNVPFPEAVDRIKSGGGLRYRNIEIYSASGSPETVQRWTLELSPATDNVLDSAKTHDAALKTLNDLGKSLASKP